MNPTLSVIVTTYGSRRVSDVVSLLRSLYDQSYNDFEIVVVAEDSEGLDTAISSAFGTPLRPYLRFLENCGTPGISHSRNLGVETSRGDVVAFVDDDALPDSTWASEILRTFQDESVIGVTGPVLPHWIDNGSRLPEALHWLVGCSSWYEGTRVQDIRNVWGANMAFRRVAFQAAGGFSEKIGGVRGTRLHGEETDFSLRVKAKTGKRIVYNSKARVMHKVPDRRLRLRNVVWTSYWYGYSRRILSTLHPEMRWSDQALKIERTLLLRTIQVVISSAFINGDKRLSERLRPLLLGVPALASAAVGYVAASLPMFRSK